jgi:hypothetical protein
MNFIVSRKQCLNPICLCVKSLLINPSYKSMHSNWWPPGCEPLGYKMIFKMKLKDRSIDKYKTIFFVEGYKQKE